MRCLGAQFCLLQHLALTLDPLVQAHIPVTGQAQEVSSHLPDEAVNVEELQANI